jgi:hypothetical protein
MAMQEGHLQHFNKPHNRVKDSALADIITLLSIVQSPALAPSQQSSAGGHRSPAVSTRPLATSDGVQPTTNRVGDMDVDIEVKPQIGAAGTTAPRNGADHERTRMEVDDKTMGMTKTPPNAKIDGSSRN